MQINDNGTVTIPMSDLVIVNGVAKTGQNAGKPYSFVKIDSRRSFAFGRDPIALQKLTEHGVTNVNVKPKS
ncbi:hypothetical protein M0R04_06610 [Candidatus Dojkabacteria bacterium]|jgi:hypothetical protein|nr:hypothetical protein [Candidatus Dojkabacteria bacterium]